MAPRNKTHLVVPFPGTPKKFQPVATGGGSRPSDVPRRRAYANTVLRQIEELDPTPAEPGVYVALKGRPNEPVDSAKFDKSGLRLLSYTPASDDPGSSGDLVFFAPLPALTKLSQKVEQFGAEVTKTGRPKNADLVQSIGTLTRANLRSLWRGPTDLFPRGQRTKVDWEVWVLNDEAEVFAALAEKAGLPVADDRLYFPEQTVLRLRASRVQLAALVRTSDAVTALAKPAVTADFFDSLPVDEQPDWTNSLLARTTFTSRKKATSWVTLLDTGVALSHPLICDALHRDDRHVANPAWGLDDVIGHGTGMAGLALFGDLSIALHSANPVEVQHRLESVKVIPDAGVNPHHLLGAVTRRGVERVEAGAERRRVFALASSTPDDHPHDGAPTSWSVELDQLAAGTSGQKHERLFVVAAGNVKTDLHRTTAYHAICDAPSEEIEAPGQAWNVVTVGAFTEKTTLTGGLRGKAVASLGDLSPLSKTASWAGGWPLKPDVVFEGGNLLLTATPPAMTCADLSLLTTFHQASTRHYTTFEATSAATALASKMTAQIWTAYPDRWPETIRALLVSSARWTHSMLSHLPAGSAKGNYDKLFQRYGYGVPDLGRAIRSGSDAVTLIVEDNITPYTHSNTRNAPAVHNHIKLHRLPWPTKGLRSLGNQSVRLRVTLSTFVEPNPAEAARGRKLQYGSHGLRFKLKRAGETAAAFEKRINAAAAAEDMGTLASTENDGWRFGSRRRDVGSLHIDELTCLASDLAQRGIVAVHPVAGWWKSKLKTGQVPKTARYALIIEIDAEGANIDLYSEVEAAITAQVAATAAAAIKV